jgi:hypothetical protein
MCRTWVVRKEKEDGEGKTQPLIAAELQPDERITMGNRTAIAMAQEPSGVNVTS